MTAERSSEMRRTTEISNDNEPRANKKKGMVLPFAPLSITFENVKYSVEMPQVYLSFHEL